MALSLQDQLRKAGLVKEKQVKNEQKRQHADDVRRRKANAQQQQQPQNQLKKQPNNKQPVQAPPAQALDPLKQLAQQQMKEKAERDRQLNQQREEKLRARALSAEIRQLLDGHREKREGDVAYNFVLDKKIKKIYVTAAQRDALTAGRLRVIATGEQYDIVKMDVAEKIHARDPSRVVPWRKSADEDLDEHYAKFQVPDDLDW